MYRTFRIAIWITAALIGMALFASAVNAADELTDAVNQVRSQHGLGSLQHDQDLAAWAAENNRHGFGHSVMGPARYQNAAGNYGSVAGVLGAWMGSPGHRRAILAIDVTLCGGAYSNGCWTLNLGVSGTKPAAGAEGQPPREGMSIPTAAACHVRRGFHPFRRLFRGCGP